MPGKQLLHAMATVSKELLFIMNRLCLSFSCESGRERLTMKAKSLHEVTRGILTTSGIISIFSGIFAFFSVFSYKPRFFGCSVCLASPIWKELWEAEQKHYQRKDKATHPKLRWLKVTERANARGFPGIGKGDVQGQRGSVRQICMDKVRCPEVAQEHENSKRRRHAEQFSLAFWQQTVTIVCGPAVHKKDAKLCLSPQKWEASFAFGILSITGASVQFAAAIASLLLGPYCYCSLAGIAGTKYLGYAVLFPFPYVDFPNLCKDPSRYEWSHLTLQILDLFLNLAIFCASLGFVMAFVRLLQFGHLNVSIGHGGEGGLLTVMPLTAARRVARLCKVRQIRNALPSGSVVPLKPRASFH
ncbi:LOW QUALITY PROTEIN: transmembrane protein 212 [Harpia harpyja]|uniref:LOW QUALITY PROTEIN: transmembrane protein 212 n=1 Tax=Harpia harpyja TaxID=202280 RepID=UPI0022B200C5|nr:LOW QUALITY PROTEIN: transmembrane protein 212 [Harpia harpyja]